MSEPPNTITVWLIEDNEVYRLGLSRAIESADGMRCPEAYADAESALGAIDSGMIPDVILLDVELPGMDGLSALKRFANGGPLDAALVQEYVQLCARFGREARGCGDPDMLAYAKSCLTRAKQLSQVGQRGAFQPSSIKCAQNMHFCEI